MLLPEIRGDGREKGEQGSSPPVTRGIYEILSVCADFTTRGTERSPLAKQPKLPCSIADERANCVFLDIKGARKIIIFTKANGAHMRGIHGTL